MFKRKKIILTIITLFGILAKQSLLADGWSGVITGKRVISVAAISTAAFGIYKYGPTIYNTLQERINNKINEEIIDSLILLLTPNYMISKLGDEEKKQKLEKKARLISAKDRIIKKLETSHEAILSKAHKKQLQENITKAKTIFNSANYIDKGISFLTFAPGKLEYKEPSFIDEFVEDRVCSSIIFASKPINEYTESEKIRRAKNKEAIKQIIARKIAQFGESFILQEQILNLLFG